MGRNFEIAEIRISRVFEFTIISNFLLILSHAR